MKGILERAFKEGLEGRPLMIQERLARAREVPPEHAHVLAQIQHYGKALPPAGMFTSQSVH